MTWSSPIPHREAVAGARAARPSGEPASQGSLRPPARWQCVRLLGRGRATRVWQARPADRPADAPADYALKVVDAAPAGREEAAGELRREAWVASRIDHPNVIPVLATGLEAEPPWLALPCWPSVALDRLLAAAGPLDPPHALWLARQAAGALQAVHAAGWLHGDVKPANLLVAASGHLTVIDLGLARRRAVARRSPAEPLRGSVHWLAPEHYRLGEPIDAASDVYALGVVLFEMLAGRLPFPGDDPATVAAAHLTAPVPDPRSARPDLPPRAARLVRAMLARQPVRRPVLDEVRERLAELEVELFDRRAA